MAFLIHLEKSLQRVLKASLVVLNSRLWLVCNSLCLLQIWMIALQSIFAYRFSPLVTFWGAYSITRTLVLASAMLESFLWFISPKTWMGPPVGGHQFWNFPGYSANHAAGLLVGRAVSLCFGAWEILCVHSKSGVSISHSLLTLLKVSCDGLQSHMV